jgi:uncharacterized protein YheU (UPF0270 family)
MNPPINETPCVQHEEQIQELARKTTALETKSKFKEDSIKELKKDMKELKDTMKTLDNTINEFILKSVTDDGSLRELVNKQDNRITALETTNKVLKWVIAIGFTALTSAVAVMAFLLSHIH